jgi:hypothetical protein
VRGGVIWAALLAAGCAHGGPPPLPTVATVHLLCDVPEGEVYVDDYYVGRCARWRAEAMVLQVGFHRIEVRAAGRYPFYGEVTLAGGALAQVQVELRETLD